MAQENVLEAWHAELDSRRAQLRGLWAAGRLAHRGRPSRWTWLSWALWVPLGLLLAMARGVLLTVSCIVLSSLVSTGRARKLMVRVVFPLMGWRLVPRHVSRLRDAWSRSEATMVVCNHVFYLDSALLGAVLSTSGLGPPALLAGTMMGGESPFELLRSLGLIQDCIYTRGMEATEAQRELTRRSLLAWSRAPRSRALLVFPEGQVHNGDTFLMRYEKHCFGLDICVVPAALRIEPFWPVQLWTAQEWLPVSWLLLLGMPWTTWHLTFLDAETRASDESAVQFARRVQQATATELGVEATDITLRDLLETEA